MLIKRNEYLENIRRFYESNLIKVLTGVRRCGKSVLLNQIKEELVNEKKIREDHIISINFEDVKFSKIKNFNTLNDYILKRIKDIVKKSKRNRRVESKTESSIFIWKEMVRYRVWRKRIWNYIYWHR
mgnify:CR=1 FL=1